MEGKRLTHLNNRQNFQYHNKDQEQERTSTCNISGNEKTGFVLYSIRYHNMNTFSTAHSFCKMYLWSSLPQRYPSRRPKIHCHLQCHSHSLPSASPLLQCSPVPPSTHLHSSCLPAQGIYNYSETLVLNICNKISEVRF